LTQTENNFVPTLTFPADFADDWERFDDKTRAGVGDFLKRLQANPYDSTITAITEKNGGYFATPIGPVIVYWKPAHKSESFESALGPPDTIYVLAVHPANHMAQ
jgi:hypothetical protein